MSSMPPAGDIEVRPLRRESIPRAVQIHLDAFPGFFLARLGPGVLRVFYTEFVERPDDVVALEALIDGRPVGTAVGPLRPDEFFRTFIRRRRVALAACSTLFMVRHPRSIPRILRAVRYRGGTGVADGALLSSIAVDPTCRGRGIGRTLLRRWTEAVVAEGAGAAHLTTDFRDNDGVIDFYRALGWSDDGVFKTREGREMLRMVNDLTTNRTGDRAHG